MYKEQNARHCSDVDLQVCLFAVRKCVFRASSANSKDPDKSAQQQKLFIYSAVPNKSVCRY